MQYTVDMNSDLGESFGAYKIGMDSEVLKYITSANVACGWHAGDPLIMEKTVVMAKEAGTAVGAHPGYNDLMGFGRRNMVISPAEAKAYIKYQMGALMAFTQSNGIKLQHVKPHGAFYNMSAKNLDQAMAICQGIYEVDKDVILLGLANSKMIEAAKIVGLKYASEVFADRAYMDDGTLAPRSMPGSVLHDEDFAIERVIRMIKEGYVESINGNQVPIKVDSICVHGDNPKALAFVSTMRDRLISEGIRLAPLTEIA